MRSMVPFMLLFCSVLTLAAVYLFFRLWRAINTYRVRRNYTAALEAPSVSVCIPARNEMHAMTDCLERVLASTYPKLEIIVYDDSSADETSTLVRSFAHEGVRFVAGSKLPKGWLGRNHALEVLAKEANGTFIVFLDVDTYIQPTTISWLVGHAMTEDYDMVSVIPRRNDIGRASVLFGTLRHFWQLLLSSKKYPPATSSLWLIKRTVLRDTFGGFASFSSTMLPEVLIARQLGKRFHCLISTNALGVGFEKKWRSQVESSKRLLYPLFGGNLIGVFGGLLFLLLLNMPLAILLSSVVIGWSPLHTLSAVYLLAFILLYGIYLHHAWARRWWLGMWLWPVAIFQELILFIASVYAHKTNTLTWKGRPIVVRS